MEQPTYNVYTSPSQMKYVPSGSSAKKNPDESDGIDFIYAKMNFFIPYYKPRM